jgi:hypothetical protein
MHLRWLRNYQHMNLTLTDDYGLYACSTEEPLKLAKFRTHLSCNIENRSPRSDKAITVPSLLFTIFMMSQPAVIICCD